ncbi:MAG: glycosyltransferase family 2 protein [Nitrospirae bacterium]|nr:glycosyltransferase family 2 protein [Nitrospirota bacterium]
MSNLVSILIPAYNAEKWIKYTIESALSQTWGRKEIIIVDDGSSDKTLQIAKKYESKSVKVVTQENGGASAARNRALKYAQGDYIQWLDADDLLHPEKIALQLDESDDGQSSRTLLTCSWGKFYFRQQKAKINPDSLWQDAAPVDWIMRKFMDNVWMNPAVWLVSRRLTEMAGPWDERLSISGVDDGEYICRVVAASERVKFVPNARSYYRQSGFSQLSRTYTNKSRESLLLAINLSIGHLRSLEESERTRSASLIYLQSYLSYFYFITDEVELLDKIRVLAHELGGELMPPKLNMKEGLMCKLFGMKKGRQLMRTLRKLRFGIPIKWDEWLFIISKPEYNQKKS